MSKLAEGLSRFFGRVEILARGADDERRAAERALAKGHWLEARSHARALLSRVPRSPLGLALWADAAAGCWLDDEVVHALSQLADQLPWRQEVWLRLGQAGRRIAWSGARDALERAAASRGDLGIQRSALLELADADIAAGEMARAQRWLERIPSHPSQPDPELSLRISECAFALGDFDTARASAGESRGLDPSAPTFDGRTTLGGRQRLLRARVARRWPDEPHGGDPITLTLGAYLLGAPGSGELLADLVAQTQDAALVASVRRATDALGHSAEPRWQAAFALAEGRRNDARDALMLAVRGGDNAAARTLATLAIGWRDLAALDIVARYQPSVIAEPLHDLLAAGGAAERGAYAEALALLAKSHEGDAEPWAKALLAELVARWIGRGDEPSQWEAILRELRRAATALDRMDLVAPIEALAVERQRPLFVAVLGEFNSGKSTLLNALLGTDVAPTGIRPTTATLHWTAWAPDAFARVVVRGGSDRVVGHEELKSTLDEVRQSGQRIERVFIYAPIERLKRIEILDTPGFNAPDESHADEARRGIEEAHVALWLLDATAPLKHSERQVIEQIAAAGVPIQVLVNKRDRVADEIDRVMEYIRRALKETQIASLAPPVAFSAQLALAGRLGDAAALEASHWHEVEALLSEHIVNRCDALRERALRRKARHIGTALAAVATAEVDAHAEARSASRARVAACTALAARLNSDREQLAETMLGSLEPALASLRADARPVEQLPDERRGHPEVRRYLVDRTVERLAPAVCDGIAHLADGVIASEISSPSLQSVVRATLAGAAAALPGRVLSGDPLRGAIEQALHAAASELDRTTVSLPRVDPRRGTALCIGALTRALGPSTAGQNDQ